MQPSRGPHGGGAVGSDGDHGGHGVDGNDHGSGNRGGRRGLRGGGGKRERPFNPWPEGHPDAPKGEFPELTYDDEALPAANIPQNAASTTPALNAASSTPNTLSGVTNSVNAGKSTPTDQSVVSTPGLSMPANPSAVPSTADAANPVSLPAANSESQINLDSSIQGGHAQDTPVMTVTNPASVCTFTVSSPSAATTSNVAPISPSLVPSTPNRIFGTFGSNNRPSFGTSFATGGTFGFVRSSTLATSSLSPAPSATGPGQPLQSSATLSFPSPSINKSSFGAFRGIAMSSAPPASFIPSPLSAFGSNATTFAAPTVTAPAAFAAPQFREHRESSLAPSASPTTNTFGAFEPNTNAVALPPALRRPVGTIPWESAERTNINLANQPQTQATQAVLGKHRAASESLESNSTRAAEGAGQANKRLKTEGQTVSSTQELSNVSQAESVSAFLSQELQSLEDSLKELDHDFEERDRAWIKRQELEAWREAERKKLATRREACVRLLQSARDKMETILAGEARLQKEYLEKLEAIERRGSGNA